MTLHLYTVARYRVLPGLVCSCVFTNPSQRPFSVPSARPLSPNRGSLCKLSKRTLLLNALIYLICFLMLLSFNLLDNILAEL